MNRDRTGSDDRGGGQPSLRSSRSGPAAGLVRGSGWLGSLERWTPPLVQGIALILMLGVGIADRATGYQLSFSIFYLIPVSLVAWRLGARSGVLWAVLAAVVWFAADQANPGMGPAVAYWNALVRLGLFLAIALSLGAARALWDDARTMAGTDFLTGVLNARSFEELTDLERTRALRYDRPFTLAYLDVDGFKAINDTHGHAAGDRALQLVAMVMRENVRSMDSVARLGGDEFALLFPETGPGAAEVALSKLQEGLDRAMEEEGLELTFSIGGVICVGPPDSVERLIQRADSLMRNVKSHGGSAVTVEVLDDNFGIEAILQRG